MTSFEERNPHRRGFSLWLGLCTNWPGGMRKHTMTEANRNDWRQLCNAALEAKDPDERLKIVQDLNRALKREEQVRRDFREARRANNASEEIQC